MFLLGMSFSSIGLCSEEFGLFQLVRSVFFAIGSSRINKQSGFANHVQSSIVSKA
jgi:hypothetical protein